MLACSSQAQYKPTYGLEALSAGVQVPADCKPDRAERGHGTPGYSAKLGAPNIIYERAIGAYLGVSPQKAPHNWHVFVWSLVWAHLLVGPSGPAHKSYFEEANLAD